MSELQDKKGDKKMSKIKDLEEVYKCDECGHTFKGRDVLLTKPATNIKMMPLHGRVIGVDKDGIITLLSEPVLEGDRLLACPKCHRVHLFGFNTKQ